MDAGLLAWTYAVAARSGARIPPLWLFTDAHRLPDPRHAAERLPRGLAGIVLRHDGDAERTRLGRDLARICRARRLVLVVAGDVRLAALLHAGVHLRGGHWPGPGRIRRALITSSAHNMIELRRAQRAGATLVFLSPVFSTPSHPDAPSLGTAAWVRLSGRVAAEVGALGGIDGRTVRHLARQCRAIGAITALA